MHARAEPAIAIPAQRSAPDEAMLAANAAASMSATNGQTSVAPTETMKSGRIGPGTTIQIEIASAAAASANAKIVARSFICLDRAVPKVSFRGLSSCAGRQ